MQATIGGVGTDIVGMDRVRTLVNGTVGDRFLQRILTERELQLTEKMSRERLCAFAAGRFAAKEAVVKAFGCGIGESCGFHDIEIMPDHRSKPECTVSDAARKRLGLPDTDVVHVSISHCEANATAFAIWEMRRS